MMQLQQEPKQKSIYDEEEKAVTTADIVESEDKKI
jgi:hypothetical protein